MAYQELRAPSTVLHRVERFVRGTGPLAAAPYTAELRLGVARGVARVHRVYFAVLDNLWTTARTVDSSIRYRAEPCYELRAADQGDELLAVATNGAAELVGPDAGILGDDIIESGAASAAALVYEAQSRQGLVLLSGPVGGTGLARQLILRFGRTPLLNDLDVAVATVHYTWSPDGTLPPA